jgi:hypothetical protein
MLNLLKKIGLSAIVFMVIPFSTLAQGREVTIFFKDGKQKLGELLSVRDSVISILKNSVEDDQEIAANPEIVEIAFLKDIDRVRLEEYDVSGAGRGALIGAGLGAVVSIGSVYNDRNSFSRPESDEYIGAGAGGALAGALYGLLIGWGVGMILSEDAEIVRPSVTKGLRNIREYARFDNGEPRYVRDIIDNLLKDHK